MSEPECSVYVNGHLAYVDSDLKARDWARTLIKVYGYELLEHHAPGEVSPGRIIKLENQTDWR